MARRSALVLLAALASASFPEAQTATAPSERSESRASYDESQITREGAIWYAPRGSQDAPAFGVLYPDMDKITALGAFYTNGPPGYAFKPATSTGTK